MSDFISLRQNPLQATYSQTKKLDLQAVLKVAPKYLNTNIDIIEVIRLLHAYGYLPRDLHRELLHRYMRHEGTNSQKFSSLLLELVSILAFKDLVRFIKTLGYDNFAIELMIERHGEHAANIMQGACIGLSEEILTYYAQLKCYMDDNVFHDRKAVLEMRSNALLESFNTFDDLDDKQMAVNRYVVVTFLRATLFKERADRERILNEMKNNIPNDVDSRFANIVYNGKMAITAMRANDERTALEYVNTALRLCDNCEQQFVRVFAHHDQQYVYRCLQSASPTEEYLKNTLTSGQLGLDVIVNLTNNKSLIWRKALTTEIVMALLKIKNNFDVMYDQPVADCDLLSADRFIKSLDRYADGTYEKRTSMKTALCKARIYEKTNPEMAQHYSKVAVQLARDGSHFTTDLFHISRYNEYLHSNTTVKQVV